VSWEAGGGLRLVYVLTVDRTRLRVPPLATPGRVEGLWRHTCFEAFIQGADAPAYREFNFAPSGQWQAYAFTDYRQGGPLASAPAPQMDRADADATLTLVCQLPAVALPPGRQLRLGLTAVIEAADASLSYWSLCHPPGKPDFHHVQNFFFTLDRP